MNGDEEEQPIARDDKTPPLSDQAKLNGWKADIFNFGKGEVEGVSYFNPGLVRRPDGLWLVARRSINDPNIPVGKNDICAFLLDEQTRVPKVGYPLKFLDSKAEEHFEDPRVIRWNNQTWVSAINFTWYGDGSWTGAHICLGYFGDDAEWTPIARRDPPVGTNRAEPGDTGGKHNKNWAWFFQDGKLNLLHHSDPWEVIEFGSTWDEQKRYVNEGVRWNYGHIRGGTPPILVGDQLITFFHSSMPWRGRYRRYYMGAIAFESKPPYRPLLWTQEPLLIGSQNDPWHQRKPLVVFPCGALLENDRWLISYGINDLKSGWVEIPHEDIQKLLLPIPVAPASILLAAATERPIPEKVTPSEKHKLVRRDSVAFDYKDGQYVRNPSRDKSEIVYQAVPLQPEGAAEITLRKRQAAAARARAAMAEKRALGLISPKTHGLKKNRRAKIRKRKKTIETEQIRA